jgi:hypothetical protein
LLTAAGRFVAFEVFGRDVVFRDLPGPHRAMVGVRGILNPANYFSLEVLSFFDEFLDAFGTGFFDVREALGIAGLST